MKKTIILMLVLITTYASHAQKSICIAFYNQENLFDTIDDPHKNDNEFLPTSKKEWNTEKYLNKLQNMSKVISSINDNKAPDIIGMAEVENKEMAQALTSTELLKKHKYTVVHFESPDERSIDNALLFKSSQFKLISATPVPVILSDFPNVNTRDILMVRLEQKKKPKSQVVVLVNHFPSRLGGEKKSEPKRWGAAQILRNVCDSLFANNPQENIVIMGDFNDEPTNSSMDSVLRAKASAYDLNNGNLFNAMYEMKLNNEGSYLYRGHYEMLDQIILSSSITNCTGTMCYEKSSATVYKQDWMLEQEGKYKGSPKRTYAGNKFLNGYSDHLPVYIYLNFKK
ncbi:MAG: endonuclease/exonuclease/phosphatase family protein [Bacteroidia bacterium]|nr:endonuclease/exonuclease/phosphatase family protein [Bacteroidia bacterium]